MVSVGQELLGPEEVPATGAKVYGLNGTAAGAV